MFQLIYISTAHTSLSDEEIEEILRVSRTNNAKAGITGLLVYDGVRFLQALEGEKGPVESTFARIKQDSRHKAQVVLSQREIDVKQFGQWSMASQEARASPGAISLPQIVDALVASVSDPNTRALFTGFSRIDRLPRG